VLTPEEIRERRFLVTVPGYDQDEVHSFLAEIATAVEEDEDEPGVPRSARFAEIGQAATQVLEAADAAAAELRAHGERDAARMEVEARERAEAVTRDAEERAQAKLEEAQQILEEAEDTQHAANRKAAELERERTQFARSQERALELIRRAGAEAREYLEEANRSRQALASAIDEVHARLGDGFANAAEHVGASFETAEAVARELEQELGVQAPRPDGEGADEAPASRADADETEAPTGEDAQRAAADDAPEGQPASGGDAPSQEDPSFPEEGGEDTEDESAFFASLASRIRETSGGPPG
jgi:DivIVA domain-containing protein